jgi:hypothetical protein
MLLKCRLSDITAYAVLCHELIRQPRSVDLTPLAYSDQERDRPEEENLALNPELKVRGGG